MVRVAKRLTIVFSLILAVSVNVAPRLTWASATPPSGPFGGDDTGFIPPDALNGPIAKCESGVAKSTIQLVATILQCQISRTRKPADSAGEDACDAAAKAAFVAGTATAGCSPCTDLAAIADGIENAVDIASASIYCASGTSFGGDDSGSIPSDAPNGLITGCENGVAKSSGDLANAIITCHIDRAAAKVDLAGEESCEQTAIAAFTSTPGLGVGCDVCTSLAGVGSIVEQAIDASNGLAFCAPSGSTPIPTPLPTPTSIQTPGSSASPTPTSTPKPTAVPTPTAKPTTSPRPTASPMPTPQPSIVPSRLTSLAISPTAVSLVPGQKQAFQVTATFANGSMQDFTSRATYQSSKPSIATIDATGQALALASGSTDITATDPTSRKTAQATLTVATLQSIAISPPSAGVRLGEALQLKAVGTYDDGQSADITAAVAWASSNTSIATVGTGGTSNGLVKGLSAGATKITATDPVSRLRSDPSTGQVTVVATLGAVTVSPPTRVLQVGQTSRFNAIGTFEHNITVDITNDVDWSTGNPAVASIDTTGRAKGLSIGGTTVQVKDRQTGITSTSSAGDAALTVVGAITSVKLVPTTAVLALGQTVALQTVVTFQNQPGSFKFRGHFEWTSSNPAAITVDTSGVAACVGVGTATVVAKDPATGVTSTASGGDSSLDCAGKVQAIQVSPAHNILQPGTSRQMKAFRVFPNAVTADATRDVTWSSTNPKVVSIVANGRQGGLATALVPGLATIVAVDPLSGLSSQDSGGTSGMLGVPGIPQSVTIFPLPAIPGGSLTGTLGGTLQLKARVQYQGGVTQGVNNLVEWSSSDPAIVAVSNGDDGHPAGFAQFLRRGTVTVTIDYPKVGASPTPTPAATPTPSGTVGPTPRPSPSPTPVVTLTSSVQITVQ
jgi:hypothetical protein